MNNIKFSSICVLLTILLGCGVYFSIQKAEDAVSNRSNRLYKDIEQKFYSAFHGYSYYLSSKDTKPSYRLVGKNSHLKNVLGVNYDPDKDIIDEVFEIYQPNNYLFGYHLTGERKMAGWEMTILMPQKNWTLTNRKKYNLAFLTYKVRPNEVCFYGNNGYYSLSDALDDAKKGFIKNIYSGEKNIRYMSNDKLISYISHLHHLENQGYRFVHSDHDSYSPFSEIIGLNQKPEKNNPDKNACLVNWWANGTYRVYIEQDIFAETWILDKKVEYFDKIYSSVRNKYIAIFVALYLILMVTLVFYKRHKNKANIDYNSDGNIIPFNKDYKLSLDNKPKINMNVILNHDIQSNEDEIIEEKEDIISEIEVADKKEEIHNSEEENIELKTLEPERKVIAEDIEVENVSDDNEQPNKKEEDDDGFLMLLIKVVVSAIILGMLFYLSSYSEKIKDEQIKRNAEEWVNNP